MEESDIYPPFAQNRNLKWLLFGNMVVDTIIVRTVDSMQVDLAASLENFFYYCTIRTILFQFPNVEIIDAELPYVVSTDFSNYLLTQYTSNNMTELQRGLDLIEKYYKVQKLATVGFLEDIQTTWTNHATDSELMLEHLGTESKKIWGKLNDFWNSVKI